MGHERLYSFALIWIERDSFHHDSVIIDNFIEKFKLCSNKRRKILLYVKGLIKLASRAYQVYIVSVIIVNVRQEI